jgi:hypothetical protein
VSSGVTDVSGNPLSAASWSFTTAVDATAPVVAARTPAAGVTGVTTAGPLTATFDERVQGVDAATFTLRSAAGVVVPATVRYDTAGRVATLTPAAPLEYSTGYTATLTGGPSGIRDLSGNGLADTSWSFTTAARPDTTRPSVSTQGPASNATGVAQTANITATFSEPVTGVGTATFTLKNAATGAAVGATSVAYNATTRVAAFDPNVTLAADTKYTASLGTGIRDAAGNSLTATTWTFTTGPTPTVSARTPGINATGVAQTANITATFSEPVTGVGTATFTVKNAATGAAVGATSVAYNATTRVATFDPNVTLAADTRYTATLASGIRDAAGNPVAATSWTFTTGPAPTVTGRTPAVNATRVGRTANITATFSEAVAGVSATTFRLKNAGTGAAVAGTVTRNGTTNQWILNPGVTLAASTKYTVTLTGGAAAIRDARGNPLTTTSWSFTTGTA